MAYILAVDDEPDFRSLLGLMLRGVGGGMEIRMAVNGQEALDIAQSEPPRLILLDIMMPVLDGHGFLQAIQENPDLSSVPVIVLTALDRNLANLPTVSNPIQHLQKGRVTPAILRERVNELLGG